MNANGTKKAKEYLQASALFGAVAMTMLVGAYVLAVGVPSLAVLGGMLAMSALTGVFGAAFALLLVPRY